MQQQAKMYTDSIASANTLEQYSDYNLQQFHAQSSGVDAHCCDTQKKKHLNSHSVRMLKCQ